MAIGGHCSVNGTSTRKRSAQPLPPEIEIRDRDRKCGAFRTSRASRVAPTPAKPLETVRKTRPRLVPVEVGRTAWRWTRSGANRSRCLPPSICGYYPSFGRATSSQGKSVDQAPPRSGPAPPTVPRAPGVQQAGAREPGKDRPRYCQVSVPRASRYSGSWSQLESGGNRDCIPNEERTTS